MAIVHGAMTANKTLWFSCCFLALGGQESVPQNAPRTIAKPLCVILIKPEGEY